MFETYRIARSHVGSLTLWKRNRRKDSKPFGAGELFLIVIFFFGLNHPIALAITFGGLRNEYGDI
jgi:hypothetical protein